MGTPENVANVDSLISPDQSLTIDKVAIKCGLSHKTIHTIIHEDLGLSNLSACSVPPFSQMTTKGMEFMTKKRIKLLPHAPYSPDLAPCDFWLFPQLKTFLAKSKFDTKMELKAAVEGYMREVSKNGLLFVMESWDKRLTKCIELQGDYVKK